MTSEWVVLVCTYICKSGCVCVYTSSLGLILLRTPKVLCCCVQQMRVKAFYSHIYIKNNNFNAFWLHYKHSKVYFICVLQIPSCQRDKANKEKTNILWFHSYNAWSQNEPKECFLWLTFLFPENPDGCLWIFGGLSVPPRLKLLRKRVHLVILSNTVFVCVFHDFFCFEGYQKYILWCWQRCGYNKSNANERRNLSVQGKVLYTWENLSFAFKILLAFCTMKALH